MEYLDIGPETGGDLGKAPIGNRSGAVETAATARVYGAAWAATGSSTRRPSKAGSTCAGSRARSTS